MGTVPIPSAFAELQLPKSLEHVSVVPHIQTSYRAKMSCILQHLNQSTTQQKGLKQANERLMHEWA